MVVSGIDERTLDSPGPPDCVAQGFLHFVCPTRITGLGGGRLETQQIRVDGRDLHQRPLDPVAFRTFRADSAQDLLEAAQRKEVSFTRALVHVGPRDQLGLKASQRNRDVVVGITMPDVDNCGDVFEAKPPVSRE